MSRIIDADRIDWRLAESPNMIPAEEHMLTRAKQLIDKQPTTDAIDRHMVRKKIEKYCTTQCSFAKYYFGRFNADDAMERLEKKCENCPLHEIR